MKWPGRGDRTRTEVDEVVAFRLKYLGVRLGRLYASLQLQLPL
jgi:hypothetical protein